MKMYLSEFSYDELYSITSEAYESFGEDPAPTVKVAGKPHKIFMLELWHGPTYAFKDMALAVLPRLLTACKNKDNRTLAATTLVLVATSGDTGKAALEGFKDVPGTKICVFYPSEGVSGMQKLQMQTSEGGNVAVYGVKGNFDDCQSRVKEVFASENVAKVAEFSDVSLSSANSINFGRLLPQIVYYISAYLDMLTEKQINEDEAINFVVPTGNFGNILAGYYAKEMGLPVNKLICASNANNVLTDFFNKGEYNSNRKFHKTMSPSMDILISSNLERLLYESAFKDAAAITGRMTSLKSTGKYRISQKEQDLLHEIFFAGFLDEDDTVETVQDFFLEHGYALDPHTGVAAGVYKNYLKATQDKTKTVIVSTASPYKFPQDVLFSITGDFSSDSFRAAKKLYKETALEIPESLLALKGMPIRHKEVINGSDIEKKVLDFIERDSMAEKETAAVEIKKTRTKK